jgi:hypothetical protein
LFVATNTVATVTGVFAAGSAWSNGLVDSVDGGGTGAGNGLGYLLTPGLRLPNSGINRIYVQFSEPVVGFNASNVALLGVNVASYTGNLSVSYDALHRRGIIQINTAIVRDKLRLGVSDSVTDAALNPIDGDSNGVFGGVFNFRIEIIVGDGNGDGSVNGGDLPIFATSFNQSAGAALFNPRADWSSDGSVNGGDLPLFASNFNLSLPAAEPGSLPFGLLPTFAAGPLLGPPVDSYFARYEEDDENEEEYDEEEAFQESFESDDPTS